MDSSRSRMVSRRSDPAKSSRRSLSSSSSSFSSFSSCSSSSLVFPGDSPLNSPATPLRLLGVPFSWEQLPGKPKDYSHNRLNHHHKSSDTILPLPPHRNTHLPTTGKPRKSSKKKNFPVIVKDPFAEALLECSKDENDNEDQEEEEDNVDRRLSSKSLSKSSTVGNRFGLVNLYGSCRRTCAVSESIVYLPRPGGKATSYDHFLLPRRHR